MNFAMMPMWLCSGVFFSYERFPDFLHPVLKAIPLTALNDGLRAVMLDGSSFVGILPDLGIVAAWGIACFFVGLKIFRWS
jgi:ABC-type polysaccharide/polyol phosphate export permease